MKNFNYLPNHILYQTFKILLCISSKTWTVTDNTRIKAYKNKTENGIIFKIKTDYYLEILTPETMKLLWSIINTISRDNDGENVPHWEITVVVLLVHCNIISKDYKHDSIVLYTFVPNKSLSRLLDVSPKHFLFSKTFNSVLLHNDVWFTDQNSKPIEIEDETNITAVIN